MKQNIITLKWKENGKENQKEIDKDVLIGYMDSTKKLFYNDNKISSILVELLPGVVSIVIDKDRNEQMDMPFICLIFEDGNTKGIDIHRHYHSMIWEFFNKLCRV